jgi:hypothetical protein
MARGARSRCLDTSRLRSPVPEATGLRQTRFRSPSLGKLSVTKDIDAVLRKIEHWHQGSIAAFKIMYLYERALWNGIRWNGQRASVFSLCQKVSVSLNR